jgi:hypothetical protein
MRVPSGFPAAFLGPGFAEFERFLPARATFSSAARVEDAGGCGVTAKGEMSGNVTVLRPVERVRLDAGPIAAIVREMGPPAAEQVLTRALGDLALTMAGLAGQVRDRDLTDLHRRLRRLQRMADHVGMISLSRASAEVRTCLDQGDATAFAAVWARLIRIAESSLATEGGMLDRRR